ncbi:hypothetical protein AU210_007441 [Fusarium oxysporum f. sp. radicis-cucumerinum]|uniref:Zn(2)-C6 fungal-type domain-containing protein n=1 Tax=Fusarium oxysporum f. sp. radicis-cucumerinum TaxID=327505 RepID=A0A2H3GXH6_FUSOX|nr:hypothetical protein AU210_007441 [Fusarium oxysporum f. sp. radicis-cucumerinum]
MSSRPRTRSCAVCHRRKVRCDKKFPCAQCVRSGFECSYPPVGPPARRAKKTTISDVASRISQMEKTIEAFKAGQAVSPQPTVSASSVTPANSVPTPASTTADVESRERVGGSQNVGSREGLLFNKGKSSHYVNEVLFSRVIEQEDDVRMALATPRDEPPHDSNSPICRLNPMGWLSAGISSVSTAVYHPQRRVAVRLWKVFVDSVDPYAKVLHLPTAETVIYTVTSDPSKASNENLALCFAIYYASVTAMGPNEVLDITGEDNKKALLRYRMCLEQSLAQADFLDNPTITLLQAIAIYGAAMRVHSSGRAVWIMNGLALRSAQSIGLHRDGSKLGLSPFESEMRRRLWWYFQERDGRGAEDYGLQNPPSFNPVYGVELPRNLHDSDLFPGMKELPPSRPDWTRMTLPLCCNQSSQAWAQLFQMSCSANGIPDEDVRRRLIKDAVEKVEGILQRCNPVIPEQRMTIRTARLILCKVDVVTRRQWQILRSPDDRQPPMATEAEVTEAVELLELSNSMWQDDDLIAFQWLARAFPQYHIMLFILRHLCVCPRGELAKRAFIAVEVHLGYFKTSGNGPLNGLKWTVLTTLRERAFLLMQKVERESVNVQQDERSQQMGFQGSGEGMQSGGSEIAVPDWNMILEEFPLDMEDFSLIF